ncbi:lactonase family protein [Glutamicibacter sp. ZJUTW]|uniref:lactonase family protein n=1 Tax=Glutamicibacter sp. ZJUTW TaxID=1155384 RepID=UPI0011F26E8C|nr:lactonase family protein [Glutamicibacter sp. ZJUTW]QEP05899.1 lactonase family protein [Glutamicibacter sp. ZJUTW]
MTRKFAYVGTRTTERRGHGNGIYVYRVLGDHLWSLEQTVRAVNPGFLALNEGHQVLYAASGDHDYLTTYKIGDNGHLEELGRIPSGGINPAHITLDPSGRWLLAVNHSSGSLVAFPVAADGSLGPESSRLDFIGEPGPHRTDQTGSKPHHIAFSPDGRWFVVPDKGLDLVHLCHLDPLDGRLSLSDSLRSTSMSGPRHAVFGNNSTIYVLNELSNTVACYRRDHEADQWSLVQLLPTMPDTDTRDSRAAEILLTSDGEKVLATNRSGAGDHTPGGPQPDTMACFSVQTDGTLRSDGHISTAGIRPRFAMQDSNGQILVANEKSDQIIGLRHSDPLASPNVIANVPSPVCVVLASD